MTANFKNKIALRYLDENLNSNAYSESEKNFLKNNINWNKINVLKCNKNGNEQGSSSSSSSSRSVGIMKDINSGNNNYADSASYDDVSINYKSLQKFKRNFYLGDKSLKDKSVLSKRKYSHLSEEFDERKRKLSSSHLFEDAHDGNGDSVDGHVDGAASHENANKGQFKNKYDFEFVENYKNVYLKEGATADGVAQGKISKKRTQQMKQSQHVHQEEEEYGDELANSKVIKYASNSAEQDEDFPNDQRSGSGQVKGKYHIDKIYGTCLENVESSFILTRNMKKSYKNFIQNEKKKKKKKEADGYTNESDANVYTSILEGNRFLCPDDIGLNYALEEEPTGEPEDEDELEVEDDVEGDYFNNTPKNYLTRETSDLNEVLDMFNSAHEKVDVRNKCSDSKNEEAQSTQLDGDYNSTCNEEPNDHSLEAGRLGQEQNSNNDDGDSGEEVHPTDGQSYLTEPEKETQFFTPFQTVDKTNLVSTFKDEEDEMDQAQVEGHINNHIPATEKESNKGPYMEGNMSVPEEKIHVKEEKEKGMEEDQETREGDSENGCDMESHDVDHVSISGSQLEKENFEECNSAAMEERVFPVIHKKKQQMQDNVMGNKDRQNASRGLDGTAADAAITSAGQFAKPKDKINNPVCRINKNASAVNKQNNKVTPGGRNKKDDLKNCLIKEEVPKENSNVNSAGTVVRVKEENCEDHIRKDAMSSNSNASTMDNAKDDFGTTRIKMEGQDSRAHIKTESTKIQQVDNRSDVQQPNTCEQHDASPLLTQGIPRNTPQSAGANKCPKKVGDSVSSGSSNRARDRRSAHTGDEQSNKRSGLYENVSSRFSRIFGFSSRRVNSDESDGSSDSERDSRYRRRYSSDEDAEEEEEEEEEEENKETNESAQSERKESSASNDPNEGRTDEARNSIEQEQEDSAHMINTAQLKDPSEEGDDVNDEHASSEEKPSEGESKENLQSSESRDEDDDKVSDDTGDKVGDDTGDKDGDDTGDKVGDDTGDKVGDDTGDKVGDNTADNTGDNIGDNTADNTGDNIGDNIGRGDLTSRTEKPKSPLRAKKVNQRRVIRVKKEPRGRANQAEIETRTCNICNAVFANSKLMHRHVMSVHSDERPFECDICLKRYKRADHLKLHRIRHDLNKEEKKFQCSICQMFFKTPRQLKNCKLKHMRFSMGNRYDGEWATRKQMEDAVGGVDNNSEGHPDEEENHESGKTMQSGEEHVEGERHNGDSENGTLRGDNASEHAGTELSAQGEEGDDRQIVPYEQQASAEQLQIVPHEQQANTDKRKIEASEQQANAEQRWEVKRENCSPSRISVEIRTCNVCSMIFANKKLMKRHLMSVHSESRPYKCHLCIKTYKRSDHLKKHILTHKDNKEKIKYTCSICQSSFDTPKELRAHKIRHYTCPYENCSYSYSTISKMKYHLNKHRCNLFYSCPVCAKKFLIYKEFIQHKRSCFKKKYVCLQCNKIYLHVNGYNKHVRKVHLNIVQNYKCTVNNCNKEFSSEFSLKEHIINFHHRVKRFFCSKCNMSFGYRSSFRRHNINIHP
ncbi:hypothetical protein AK88_03727 [Plasmodium fragile]|uniref:C2H2-type domain-containing protein n=1 Tax=Plasmodium fragile TaxID=5857 RepID=A0A0D9QI59_PLAFR|nr:uncharacterized protein AK88_03727 [Plasmodium fragile]KJP86623.1 hypothetical protein AK88_03727 [Plasmodium fragile]